MKNITLSFDNTFLEPTWSSIASREDVSIRSSIGMSFMDIPIIAANMSTIVNPEFANKLSVKGAASALHRFMSVEDNVKQFKECKRKDLTWVSLGISDTEIERATALQKAGANHFLIDVAHGAQDKTVDFYNVLRKKLGVSASVMVGNFGPVHTIRQFEKKCTGMTPQAYKIGIGPGGVCSTKSVAGVYSPTLHYVQECATEGYTVVADGGIKEPRHINLCIAAGASAVMVGSYFASCPDIAARKVFSCDDMIGALKQPIPLIVPAIESMEPSHNVISGSASKESYEKQGKIAGHRAPEGITRKVEITTTLDELLTNIEGGLRSALTYSNARNIEEFQTKAKFINVSS